MRNRQIVEKGFFDMYELSPFSSALRELGDFERNFFSNASFSGMKCDVEDLGKEYVLSAELPGFDKNDIKVDISDDIMTISASHKSESEQHEARGYLRRERRYGAFSRSFNISNVHADDIKASYTNGILRIVMPKKTQNEPKNKSLVIE